MSASYAGNFGFTVLNLAVGDSGGRRTVARFRCVGCDAVMDVGVSSGVPINPEGYAKTAARKGWDTHPFRKTNVHCPKCKGKGQKANDPDSELRKVVPMTVTPIKPATVPAAQVSSLAATPPEVREPTPDQRVAIRGLLDKHFDDSAGMYLDAMTDQRVAELAGVPRLVVERLREAAYGPIRVDPVTAELRAALDAHKQEIAGQQKALDGLKAKQAELASRLERALAGVKVA